MEPDHHQLIQLLPLLPVLAELGRTEHMTETAAILGVPQSTVSRAVARASAIVGMDLLAKDGRGIRLTPAAKTLLPYIEAALEDFQAGLDRVRQESDVVRGRVGVASQHTFGEATLPLLISAYRAKHPQTVFELRQGPRDGCLEQLAAGESDFALVAPIAPEGKGIVSLPLYREPLRAVLHYKHPLAGHSTIHLSQLRHEPYVTLPTGVGLRALGEALFREAGFRPRIAFEVQGSTSARGLVSAGLGFSILPPAGPGSGTGQFLPETELGLVEVPLDSDLAFRQIGIAWRERNFEPDAVRLFRELVVSQGGQLLAELVRARSGRP
ncbi:LysR family transcriptional regulator [Paenarthrobacter ilicis]|uniref:DNA-binding transcriptional LysR family regulator n=1 Tax=Paenarthrobacter ilicis TaxID=43665 RepID=A0ABX0TFW3_9MICC|nr:LysR family transcriptional regulator [Paenarthrobacter ilicis]MBM7793901.1 DNA-binding transcriptional LysR family regulator [Paenarthrobacter ilicis]NIJ00081.1 DNA-binding transcriptional LysR family regulator [Paenarthrobacter ilicis]